MLYYLSLFSHNPDWGFLRLFNYVSFRAGGAAATAFLTVILLGPATVRMLKNFRATAPSRYGGVVEEFVNAQKDKTPSMGGVLIIPAILLGIVAGTLLSQPVGSRLCVAMLSFFGMEKIKFGIPAGYMAATAAIILAVALATAGLLGLKVRRINPVEMITEE